MCCRTYNYYGLWSEWLQQTHTLSLSLSLLHLYSINWLKSARVTRLTSRTVFLYNDHQSCSLLTILFCFLLLSCFWWTCILNPNVAFFCFFFLFYRDVEGVEPTTQSERVYRPENYCWRQRVWSPPKCSSFLQLVFQGPGEKVCLRFPSRQLLIQSVLFIGHISVAFFPFPSLSCRCVKTLVPSTGPAAIPSSFPLKWMYLKLKTKVNARHYFSSPCRAV